MTSKEFVIWLQGFTEGVHQYNITPMQWDILKFKLSEVNDEQPNFVTPPTPGITNIPILNGTVPSPGFVVTTSPGTTITTTPNGMSASITYGYPSGSAWSYTSTQKEPYTTGGPDEVIKHHNED